MTINKDKSIHDWINQTPNTDAVLVNYLSERTYSYAIVPIAGQVVLDGYTDGSKQMEYVFALQTMQPISQATDDINTQALYTMRIWQDWIDEQQQVSNYPDFGLDCFAYQLENLSNMPMLAQTYQDTQTAKYQFIARLTYWQMPKL
jgi:hypothetical protein